MTNSASKSNGSRVATGAGVVMAGAGLMILLGVVLQLAELGYGQLVPDSSWLISVLANELWSVVAVHMNVPSLHVILVYWPLLLVGLGCSTLLAMRTGNRGLATSAARSGRNYGE